MSWKSIKTFLIVLFLILNVFLIILTYKMNNAKNLSQSQISETITLLNTNNIEVDPSIIPVSPSEDNTINLTDIYYMNENTDDIIRTENELIIKIPYYTKNNKSVQNNILNSLENYGFDTENIKVFEDENNQYKIKYYINNMQVFDNDMSLNIDNDTITLKGKWYIYESENAYNWEYGGSGYATSALINFISHPKRDKSKTTTITAIDYGYYANSDNFNKNYKIISSTPCYRLTTDTGMMYYYSVSEGNFVN